MGSGISGGEVRRIEPPVYVLVILVVAASAVMFLGFVVLKRNVLDRRVSGTATPARPTTTVPQRPPDWSAPTREQATAVAAYLAGPGTSLIELDAASAPLLDSLDPNRCRTVRDALRGVDPADAARLASDVPDRPLSEMFVNVSGQIPAVIADCVRRDAAATAVDQRVLSDMHAYIRMRLHEFGAGS